jgi:putative transposon-encoded protein
MKVILETEFKSQTLFYNAIEFSLLENTGVEDGHLKISRPQGTGAGLNLPVASMGKRVLCIILD